MMNDEQPSHEIWPPPPSNAPIEEIPKRKPKPLIWPYIGGFILSICAELYTRSALAALGGQCGALSYHIKGIELIVSVPLLLSIGDVVRGALSKMPINIVFGGGGIYISFHAIQRFCDNTSCIT